MNAAQFTLEKGVCAVLRSVLMLQTQEATPQEETIYAIRFDVHQL